MRLIDGDAIIIDLLDRGIEGVQTDDYAEFQQIVEDAPTVDAVAVDEAIFAIQEMIESIDEDFPLLDFNSRYMMERGMRMSLIQIKKLRTDGERKGGDE